MTKLCIPIVESSMTAVETAITAAEKKQPDILEIWIGEITDLDLPKLMQMTKTPLLINCKGEAEKGSFQGSDKEKARLLIEASEQGAAYIDVDTDFSELEALTSSPLIRVPSVSGSAGRGAEGDSDQKTKLILSAHFFKGTPNIHALLRKITLMQERGAHICKIAAMPESLKDVITLLRLADKLNTKKIQHITIAMGELGQMTRFFAPTLQSEIMFTPLKTTSAPGQKNIDTIRNFWKNHLH